MPSETPADSFASEYPFFAFVLREAQELRRRALWCLASVGLVSGVLLGLPRWEDSYVLRFSAFPRDALLPEGAKLVFLSPLEPMAQMIKLGMTLGLVASVPVLVWHFLAFTKPALPEGLRGFYVRFVLLAFLLFSLGLAFSALVLAPLAFDMLIGYGVAAGGEAQITFERFYSFISVFLVAFALPFEIPLVMGFLHRFNLVSLDWFRSVRLQAWGVGMLLSQFIMPDPIVTPLIFSGLFIVLYEGGLLFSRRL
jgi:sec-independent protein translocase protein TatC